MTKILDEVLAANARYAENFGEKANLLLPPSRRFCDPDLYGWASFSFLLSSPAEPSYERHGSALP